MENESTDWTQWEPTAEDLPELDAATVAAVRELQGGEVAESTRHLFATFEPQLAAYFRRKGCQDDDANDLTQTVFIQILDQIETLKDPTRFHFWLFKTAEHHLFNFGRDSARDREGLEGFADKARKDSESGTFWVRGTFEPSPEARLTVSERVGRRREVLRKLLKATRLAPRTRRSLLLRLRGASYQEIARELECSAGTVGSHISRASTALIRNLERIDLDAVALDDDDADLVAALTPELLTFKREAQEADPTYASAGILEAASADFEGMQESDDEALDLLDKTDGEEETEKGEAGKVERVVDSPAEIAAVARQDRRRWRPRRRTTRTIPPAGKRDGGPDLGRLSRDDLGYPLTLLEEAAARCGERGGSRDGHAFDPLALKAKLACAGSLLARGRRFAVARRVGEIVRLAILLIGHGRRDDVRRKLAEGRGLLEAYLGRN
ncbi:MAG: sigma-70 family RNA polymerase sigma factor [bacterium]|nr:sigma-70 family RNA polymerase sigma factor [bacterium]